MKQLIDKSTLVTEIEKLEERFTNQDNEFSDGYHFALKLVLSFLDTLEVKDVDLEKESELIANEIMIGVQANKYHTNIYNTERNDFNHSHLWLAARKGIELGLKTKKEK